MTAEGVVTMFVLKVDSYMGKTHRLALQKPQMSTVSHTRQSIQLQIDKQLGLICNGERTEDVPHVLIYKLNASLLHLFLKINYYSLLPTAITGDCSVRIQRCQWNVHHREQSELRHHRGLQF